MSIQSTKCFVLHSRAFKETSLIVDLFSLSAGRFSVVAKGIKREKAQSQRAILQPFGLIQLEYSGRHELKVLRQAELINQPTQMPAKSIACGYYLNELLMRSIQEGQEFPDLFEDYQFAIHLLVNGAKLAETLRNFEVALLSELGLVPDWQFDINGNPIDPKQTYQFNQHQGFEKAEENSSGFMGSQLFLGQSLLDLSRGKYHAHMLKDCQRITQMLLRQIIGQKPLESRKLWV